MKIPTPNLWPAARTGQRWLVQAKRRETVIDGHRMVYLEKGTPAADRPTVILMLENCYNYVSSAAMIRERS